MITPLNKSLMTLLFIIIGCSFTANAQQDVLYTQFMYSKLSQNAAYTGSREALSIRAMYRDQWTSKHDIGIEGAPKTTTFTMHSPLKKEAFALGFFFMNDRLGLEQKNQFNVTYAYRIKLNKKIKLNIGINSGIFWYRFNTANAVLVNPDDNKYRSAVNRILPDVGAGVYLYHPDFYVGASFPNVIKGKLSGKNDYNSSAERTVHFVFMAGGVIPVDKKKKIKIRPQVQYSYIISKTRKMPQSFDFNLSLMLFDKVNAGIQYHTSFNNKNNDTRLTNPSTIDFMLEVWPLKQLMIGYAYDYSLSKLSSVNSGTHEIILGYEIAPKKKNKKNYQTGCYHF